MEYLVFEEPVKKIVSKHSNGESMAGISSVPIKNGHIVPVEFEDQLSGYVKRDVFDDELIKPTL